jgi:hypothetical protein
MALQDWSREGQEQRERKAWTYRILDHLPLQWQKLSRSKSTISRPLGLVFYLVLRPNSVAVIYQSLGF